jgi:hypothetical protein
MEFRASQPLPASAASVAAILADPAFYRATTAVAIGGGQIAVEATVTGTPSGAFSVAIRRTMAAGDLPRQVQAYLPGGLDLRQVNAWDPPDAQGSRHGTVTMTIVGAPIHLAGTVALIARGPDASELVNHARWRARIPLVGTLIEEAATPAVRAAVRAECDELVRRLGASRPEAGPVGAPEPR